MARYRKVDTKIWADEKFRAFSDDGKLAFLFVLTHPHLTALGAMRGTLNGLAAELGWTPKRFQTAIALAIQCGMIEVNEQASYIALPNFLRYNAPEGPNSVTKAWVAALESLPECPEKRDLIWRCRKYLDTRSREFRDNLGPAVWESFPDDISDAIPDAYGDASPIQEQEQEPEQEQEHEPDNPPKPPEGADVAPLWLDLLNRETGTAFTATEANLRPIRARIRDGHSLAQARTVVQAKVREWRGTEFDKYLRPATVFGPKFDSYLQAAVKGTTRRTNDKHRINDAWASTTQAGEVKL